MSCTILLEVWIYCFENNLVYILAPKSNLYTQLLLLIQPTVYDMTISIQAFVDVSTTIS